MAVVVRKKVMADGQRYALFLDIVHEGQRSKEYLKRYVYKKARTPLERQHNEEVSEYAKQLRNKRENELFTDEVQEVRERKEQKKQARDFFEYFTDYINRYPKKDKRMMVTLYGTLKAYVGKETLPIKQVDEQFCRDFLEYLSNRYNGESPTSFFARFKKVLKQAVREKLFIKSPAMDVMNSRTSDSLVKDVLTVEELQTLAMTYCGNEEVKRAFLFSCQTGLRFVDIKALKWKNVRNGTLTVVQEKTERDVIVNLNKTALKLLEESGSSEELVFTLPSHNGTIKVLRYWTKRAGIDKHITFHCARHSFGTNLALFSTDVLTISSLLGHSNLRHTTKYVRVAKAVKEQAVNSLPEIQF